MRGGPTARREAGARPRVAPGAQSPGAPSGVRTSRAERSARQRIAATFSGSPRRRDTSGAAGAAPSQTSTRYRVDPASSAETRRPRARQDGVVVRIAPASVSAPSYTARTGEASCAPERHDDAGAGRLQRRVFVQLRGRSPGGRPRARAHCVGPGVNSPASAADPVAEMATRGRERGRAAPARACGRRRRPQLLAHAQRSSPSRTASIHAGSGVALRLDRVERGRRSAETAAPTVSASDEMRPRRETRRGT